MNLEQAQVLLGMLTDTVRGQGAQIEAMQAHITEQAERIKELEAELEGDTPQPEDAKPPKSKDRSKPE